MSVGTHAPILFVGLSGVHTCRWIMLHRAVGIASKGTKVPNTCSVEYPPASPHKSPRHMPAEPVPFDPTVSCRGSNGRSGAPWPCEFRSPPCIGSQMNRMNVHTRAPRSEIRWELWDRHSERRQKSPMRCTSWPQRPDVMSILRMRRKDPRTRGFRNQPRVIGSETRRQLSLIFLRSVSRRGSNQGSGRRSPFVCRRPRLYT
jgi:hypothetical protein